MFNDLWVEKYRPKALSDVVLSDSNRVLFSKYSDEEVIPNLLFAGKPGIGKTSLAKIIVNDVLGCQYLYINASDENGIDTVRTKITSFSKTRSMDGGIKVIILDEVDGLTLDAQRALRNTMEEYSQYVRFILTANFHHKVIPALQSRCQNFDLTPDYPGFYKRCEEILSKEKISFDSSDELKKLVGPLYPDLRKAINELQRLSVDSTLAANDRHDHEIFLQKLLSLIQYGKVLELRQHIIKKEPDFGGDYQSLLRDLFNRIDHSDYSDDKKRDYLLCTSEHLYRSAFVLDQEINFYSCLVGLSKIP